MAEYDELIDKCRSIIECDDARISQPQGTMFLIIGFNRSTKDDPDVWVDQNGDRKDFDYLETHIVASGQTEEELIESLQEYVRLSDMTMEEYLLEMINTPVERKDESRRVG